MPLYDFHTHSFFSDGALLPMELIRRAHVSGYTVMAITDHASASNIEDLVEKVLSVDQVQTWKPAPAPYEFAVSQAGVPVGKIAMVAVHSWDIHGANAAGLTTGWCPRLEGRPTSVFTRADVIGTDLVDVIKQLSALPH